MNQLYDVVIVGGGLSGGCLALALDLAGARVAVIEPVTDRERRNSPAGNRALALSYGTACLLGDLGLWPGVRAHATRIQNIHVSDRGRFGKVRLSAEAENVEALGYVIVARMLEDCVADRLSASGVDQICPARLESLRPGPESVTLSVSSAGSTNAVETRLLVGADGGNSVVRKQMNLPCETHDYRQSAIVTTVRPQKDPAGTAYERFTAEGPLALLPTQDRCCSVIWTRGSSDAAALKAMNDAEFSDRLQACFGFFLGRLQVEGKRVQLPLKLVRAREITGTRTVLVGNAVHQLHPVAGQGFNLGMRDLAVLAEMISARCADGGDPGDSDLLRAYALERGRDHDRVVTATDGLVRIFSNDWWPLTSARNAGLLSLDACDWGKHRFARGAMGINGPRPRIGSGM